MVKRNNSETYMVEFEEFEERCKDIADSILKNKNIKNIFGVPRGGNIAATRLAYLTGLPLTFAPKGDETAIIDDVLDTGNTRHSFANFQYFYVLVDKQFENIKEWVVFWWEKMLRIKNKMEVKKYE